MVNRGTPHEAAWRTEGQQVLDRLCAFGERVEQLYETMVQPTDQIQAADVRAAMEAVRPAHDECESALGDWIERWASAFAGTGKDDPSRGGFDALTVALEDGYHGASLAHLALLGLSFSATQVAADGLTEKVEEAYELAVQLYEEATVFARSITDDMKPRTSRLNREMYTIYRSRVPEEARTAYGELHPYLHGLQPLAVH